MTVRNLIPIDAGEALEVMAVIAAARRQITTLPDHLKDRVASFDPQSSFYVVAGRGVVTVEARPDTRALVANLRAVI